MSELGRQDSSSSASRRRTSRRQGESTRVTSSNSYAGNSLRRMATHETGEYAVQDEDVVGSHTHDEHEHEHHDHDGHYDAYDEKYDRRDEEAAIESSGDGKSRAPGDDRTPPVMSDSTAKTEEEDLNGVRNPPSNGSDGERTAHEEDVEGSAGAGDDKKKKKFELTDQTNSSPVKQVMLIFAGSNCASFCSSSDQTIVATALPTLGRIFNQASIASWVGTAYMSTSTASQPVYGRLSDIFGRKSVLLGSSIIFLFGSSACALAQTMIQSIIFRAIQGSGGGGILTSAMIIISDVVSSKDRGKYQGITGGVVAVANSVGPILGGIFTEKVTWRWCFYINSPLTGLAIVVVFFFLPLKRVQGSMVAKSKKLDYSGSALTSAWAVLVLIAISWGGVEYSWTSAAVLAPLIIGIVSSIVFIVVEAKLMTLPSIPMYIFKDRTVAASMATTFANGCAFYATSYYLPQYFQVVRQESPVQSGVDMLPLTFVQVFFSFLSGFLVSKTGDYKWNSMAGFFIWTIGLGVMSSVGPDTSKAKIYGYQVSIAVGAGQTFQTSLIAIQASVARKDMATATGCRNFLRMSGGTVSLAVCAAIINNVVTSESTGKGFQRSLIDSVSKDPTESHDLPSDAAQLDAVRAAYSRGINACFWFCVPMAGLSFIITVFFIRRVSLKREDDAKSKEEGKKWVEERKAKKRAARGAVGSGHTTPATGAQTPATRPHTPENDTGVSRSQRNDSDEDTYTASPVEAKKEIDRTESGHSAHSGLERAEEVAEEVKEAVEEGVEASAAKGAEAAGVRMSR